MGIWIMAYTQEGFLMSYTKDNHSMNSIWVTMLVIQNLIELRKKHCLEKKSSHASKVATERVELKGGWQFYYKW